MCDNNLHRGEKVLIRIREIKYSNEILSHGISELEALFVRMQSGVLSQKEITDAKQNATILDRKNHCLAHSINSALKELESTFRQDMDEGKYVKRETIHEFTSVLRESIRTFHEYRLVQDGYNRMLTESENNKTTCTKPKGNRGKPTALAIRQLERVTKMFCMCGTGRNFAI